VDRLNDDAFVVLNALYLRKMADAGTLAENSGASLPAVAAAMAAALAAEGVLDLGGQYLLTDAGRAAVLEYYDRTYRDLRAAPEVTEFYEKFESTVNQRFLELVSAYQVDPADKTVDRIIKTVERHTGALDEAAKWMERYGHYAERFRRSLERFEDGQSEYLTSPTVDSLHNIWFEFHEDILAVIGRPRETVEG